MLWEREKLRFDSLLPGHIPEDTNLENELRHYGVPGMHWGEITQEKVLNAGKRRAAKRWSSEHTSLATESPNSPYSKQNKNTLGSAQKSGFSLRQRYQMHKAQNQKATQDLYRNAKAYGRKVGMNSMVYRSAYRTAKEKYEEQRPKQDIIDKTVTRLASEYGLEQFAPFASSQLKSLILNKGIEFLSTPKGQERVNKIVRKSTSAMGYLLDTSIRGYKYTAPYVKEGVQATGRGAKALANISVKAGKRTIDWLNKGGTIVIRENANTFADMLRQYGKQSSDLIRNSLRTGAATLEDSVRSGDQTLRALLRRSQNGRRG